MRIVVDLQAAQCGSRHRGIGRYSMALAKAMIKQGRQHEFFIALSGLFPDSIEPIRAAFDGLLPQDRIRVWAGVGPAAAREPDNHWRRHASAFLREAFLRELRPDMVHIASWFEGFGDDAVHSVGLLPASYGTAITFYDAIPLLHPQTYLTPDKRFEVFYRNQAAAVRAVDLALAISESSRREAIDELGFAPGRSVNIAAAADDCFKPLTITAGDEAALRKRLRLPRRFIMYSGPADERKNLSRLIQAFAQLPKPIRLTHHLALVGRVSNEQLDRLEQHVLDAGLTLRDVVITGGVADLELAQLYNLCELFVFPSWHEGFGLPVLEALSCGAAVVGSDSTSLPEVIGFGDALFDPLDVDAIAARVRQVLEDEALRDRLRSRALEQARRFSWERSAAGALEHMEQWHRNRLAPSSSPPATDRQAHLWDLATRIGQAPGKPASEEDVVAVAGALVANVPAPERRPQLFVDVSELLQRDTRSGIQRVVRGVLGELFNRGQLTYDLVPVGAGEDGPGYRRAERFLPGRCALEGNEQLGPAIDDAQPGDIFLGLDFEPALTAANARYLEALRHRGVRVWFLLHDLLPITHPDDFPREWEMARIHGAWLDVLARADGVICVSRTSADQFLGWLAHFGPDRPRPLSVAWCHNGSDIAATAPTRGAPPEAQTLRDAAAARTTFLTVATLEPRKRHVDILDAAEAAWAGGADFNVVFVGRDGWKSEALIRRMQAHPQLGARLFWLASASDEFLGELYELGDALIAASNAEGFGLPLVEAAAHGMPVIARDIPVFREIAGPATVFFADDNLAVASLAQLIAQRSCAPRVPAHLRERAASRSWQQVADELLSIILDGRHYRLWASPSGVTRFWASNPRFSTDVGERRHLEVALREATGCGLRGPRTDLQAGTYEVVIRGRVSCPNPHDVEFDVAGDRGQRILASGRLHAPTSPLAGELARTRLHLDAGCSGVEVRLWVRQPVDLSILMVEFVHLP